MWNQTWTDRLKQDLFIKYDKFARPTQHYNTTMVNFDITILYVDVASMRDIKMRTKIYNSTLFESTIGFLNFQDDFKSTVTVNGWASHVSSG